MIAGGRCLRSGLVCISTLLAFGLRLTVTQRSDHTEVGEQLNRVLGLVEIGNEE